MGTLEQEEKKACYTEGVFMGTFFFFFFFHKVVNVYLTSTLLFLDIFIVDVESSFKWLHGIFLLNVYIHILFSL